MRTSRAHVYTPTKLQDMLITCNEMLIPVRQRIDELNKLCPENQYLVLRVMLDGMGYSNYTNSRPEYSFLSSDSLHIEILNVKHMDKHKKRIYCQHKIVTCCVSNLLSISIDTLIHKLQVRVNFLMDELQKVDPAKMFIRITHENITLTC